MTAAAQAIDDYSKVRTATHCKHQNTTCGTERCYTGGVAVPPYTNENPASHGGIAYDQTCATCGATRTVNANGNHTEVSPWGPNRAERRAAADHVRRARPPVPAAVTVTAPDGRQVRVSVDETDGLLVIDGDHQVRELSRISAALAGTAFAENAVRYRQWSLDLSAALESAEA
jgi:hypothetical protein